MNVYNKLLYVYSIDNHVKLQPRPLKTMYFLGQKEPIEFVLVQADATTGAPAAVLRNESLECTIYLDALAEHFVKAIYHNGRRNLLNLQLPLFGEVAGDYVISCIEPDWNLNGRTMISIVCEFKRWLQVGVCFVC